MRVRVGGVLLAALLAITACGDDNDSATDTTTTSSSPGAETSAPDPSEGVDETPAAPADIDTLAEAAIVLTPVAEVDAPIALVSHPDSPNLFVAERAGRIRALEVGEDGSVTPGEVVLDITADTTTDVERGLLGFAFHPDGDRLYVSFTDPEGNSRIDEWALDGMTAVPESRRTMYSYEQPFANHNGGHIGFGPDGFLYLALGDGGGGGDPLDAGQDPDTALGTIIRIDPEPDGDRGYSIPADNPFADGGGRAEIFISGVRNPWRYSWDPSNRDLWIADVGQNAIEEINWLSGADGPAGLGANLGWSIFEGDQRFGGTDEPEPENYVGPIHTYSHGPGCSITGGVVVRDPRLTGLFGAYLFSDYCDPTIHALLQRDGSVVETRSLEVEVAEGEVVSFGVGPASEIYVLSLGNRIYRIDPA